MDHGGGAAILDVERLQRHCCEYPPEPGTLHDQVCGNSADSPCRVLHLARGMDMSGAAEVLEWSIVGVGKALNELFAAKTDPPNNPLIECAALLHASRRAESCPMFVLPWLWRPTSRLQQSA